MSSIAQSLQTELQLAAKWLGEADALLIAAGAGIGVDSGLPDFRGNEGFWKAYPALAASGLQFAEVASPSTFESRPDLAWGFYGHRLGLYRETVPHEGFKILYEIGERLPQGLFVFTSNVDGQFQAAGFDPVAIDEHHGSIHWLQCTVPCSTRLWPASDLEVAVDLGTCTWQAELPRCPHCGALARPNILMFHDSSWIANRQEEQYARFLQWPRNVKRPVVIELGAGTHIPSVRRMSEYFVKYHQAKLVRINPRDFKVPAENCVALPVGALEGLVALKSTGFEK